jgi:phosphoribosylformylglycinamidine synthase
VTGGNVSFYNESPESAVYPTPTIGMVGLIEDLAHITPAYFRQEGDLIYLIGETKPEIGGSEFLKEYYGKVSGDCPALDLKMEHHTHLTVLQAIRSGWVQSAHDLADGGLAVTLAECCIINREAPIGAEVQIDFGKMRPEWFLFSESQSRFLVSVKPENQHHFEAFFSGRHLPLTHLGKTSGNRLRINNMIDLPLVRLDEIYFETIGKIME